MKRVAVIGAGLSGLTLARELQSSAEVVVFEKSRGFGGRMATRTRGDYRFDHGAQYFTCRSHEFDAFLQPLIEQGVVARWDARFVELDRHRTAQQRNWSAEHPHYVAVPGMNALGKTLAADLDVRLETRVAAIQSTAQRADTRWHLSGDDGESLGSFDWVISGIPAAQTNALLPAVFSHHELIANRQMLGCYTLMLGFEGSLPLPWDAALVRDADISWISVDNSKPGRGSSNTLVVHSTNEWAEARMDQDRQTVTEHLLDELSSVLGAKLPQAGHIELHSWRYANIGSQQGDKALIDAPNRLAAIGDWCIKGRVESAFLSAIQAARELQPML